MSLYYCAMGRINILKQAGVDVRAMYPARPEGSPEAANWTCDTYLRVTEACHKIGMPFGTGLGTTGDSVSWIGQMFASFGAELIDRNGEIRETGIVPTGKTPLRMMTPPTTAPTSPAGPRLYSTRHLPGLSPSTTTQPSLRIPGCFPPPPVPPAVSKLIPPTSGEFGPSPRTRARPRPSSPT
jgi:hypothetical protein